MSGQYFAFPDEPPEELSGDIQMLSRREVTHRLRLTIGPRYPPSVSLGKWAEFLAQDLRAASEVMPGFRQSAYIQGVLQVLDNCSANTKCVLSVDAAENPATPLEQDIQRAFGAAGAWFGHVKQSP